MNPGFLDVLIFEVDGQRHGVAAADVQELLPAQAVMPLPGATAGLEGVINLRGAIVPVLNIRRCFGIPAKSVALSDHFIVIRLRDRLAALHVDHALELAGLDAAAFVDIDSLEAKEKKPRVAKLRDGMVLLHRVQDLVASVDSRMKAEFPAPPAPVADKEAESC